MDDERFNELLSKYGQPNNEPDNKEPVQPSQSTVKHGIKEFTIMTQTIMTEYPNGMKYVKSVKSWVQGQKINTAKKKKKKKDLKIVKIQNTEEY